MSWPYYKIPEVAHFYWDLSPLSHLQYLTFRTFKELNPEWTVKLYVPKIKTNIPDSWKSNEHAIKYTGKDYLDEAKKYIDKVVEVDFSKIGFRNDVSEVFKSDYIRWHLLSTEGGLWSDCDVLYVGSMDRLNVEQNMINGSSKYLDMGMITPKNDLSVYVIGFLLSRPNNEFFKLLKDNTNSKYNPDQYQCLGCNLIKSQFAKVTDIASSFSSLNISNIDFNVIYPYDWAILALFEKTEPSIIKENTIGIHWFNGTDMAKRFQNDFDSGNIDLNSNLTILNYINKYI